VHFCVPICVPVCVSYLIPRCVLLTVMGWAMQRAGDPIVFLLCSFCVHFTPRTIKSTSLGIQGVSLAGMPVCTINVMQGAWGYKGNV